MKSFTFQTTRSIINQPGFAYQLGETIKGLGVQRLILITDAGIRQTGMVEKVENGVKEANLDIFTYSKVVADPPEKVILEAVSLAREKKVEAVIGFGGGSSMDTAKLVAFLAVSSQQLDEIYGIEMAKGSRLPLVLIPTTAGTGSEVTPIAIVTRGKNQKMGVVSSQLLPDIAVLDAELTLGLPAHVTAATGVDAMVHAIEAYTTKIKKNPVSDMLAEKALHLLARHILKTVKEGNNLESRSCMLLGSMLAGQSFANAPCSAVHALAYPIGGHFHVPHGLSNSLMLPHVMRFNLSQAETVTQYAELAQIILPGNQQGTPVELSEKLIDWIEELIGELGLETKLRQVGVKEEDLKMMAEDAMKQQRLLVNNPREVSYEDALAIYTAAF